MHCIVSMDPGPCTPHWNGGWPLWNLSCRLSVTVNWVFRLFCAFGLDPPARPHTTFAGASRGGGGGGTGTHSADLIPFHCLLVGRP